MTTLIFTFIISLLASFLLTPLVGKAGLHWNIVDLPSARKVHKTPIPRIGGTAILLAFFLPFLISFLHPTQIRQLIFDDARMPFFIAGAGIVFATGFWDDLKPLPFFVKFAGQIIAAMVVYYGGIRIASLSIPFMGGVSLGIYALPVTVFWFVLVINAMNLIDGLDGLAAGICLFASVTMLFICVADGRILPAVGFTALAGTLIGFLRYNFNPASIFMGDGGSYFLGYLLAAMSIMGSIKGQMASALIIPVIALGVPIIDTLFAPIRRFVLGQKIFQPDRGHLHHRLIKLGFTQRRAVLTIYACTIFLGIASIIIIHARDETAALILLVVGSGIIFMGRYIGLMDYFDSHWVANWLHDLTDVTGLSHERRGFLNHQMTIFKAHDIKQLWKAVCGALKYLEFDLAELVLYDWKAVSEETPDQDAVQGDQVAGDRQGDSANLEPIADLIWKRHDAVSKSWFSHKGVLKIELPLISEEKRDIYFFGTLILVKDISRNEISHYTLRRIEHLRRAMNSALKEINQHPK